ncbi:tripartite tricarboxylate transporter TctB family protein [Nocardioides sp. NPDC057577]|uniref:tripartite tricarboxylate transporter TctB family protein n=1 Tax=Nocardioides sp. NPDC057577 TaxID=3346171 RepID=UPI003671E668
MNAPETAADPRSTEDEIHEHVPAGSTWAGLVFGLATLATGALVLEQGWSVNGELDPSGPRFMPVVVGALWVALAAAYVAGMAMNLVRRTVPDSVERFDHIPRVLFLIVLLIGYAYALDPVGYIVSTAVFFVVAAAVLGSREHVRDLVVAVGIAVAVYFLFSRSLGIYLPPGVLPL